MTLPVALLAASGIVAVADWVAVGRAHRRAELLLKPLTLALLLAAAFSADLGAAGPWAVLALALSLVGDVGLLFADDQAGPDAVDAGFLVGLGAFLLCHIAYVVAFARHGVHGWQLLAGALVVCGACVLALPRVLRGARAQGGAQLAGLVAAYAGLLAAMTVMAVGTGSVAAAVGGLLFLVSDVTLAWNRFAQRLLRGPLIVIVTYHLAQALIVIGLMR